MKPYTESQDNFIIELSGLDADEKAKFHQDFILKGVDMQIEPEFSICHSIGAVSSFWISVTSRDILLASV